MNDIYVLNSDLEQIGIIDTCKSVIWANRYQTAGDCELYVPATAENLALLQKNFFLQKYGNSMICQIKKIELDTDAENGNYLIVTGVDAKAILDQRIIWGTVTTEGRVENFCRVIVELCLGAYAESSRQYTDSHGTLIFGLGTESNFPEVITEQVSYKNLGEKIREYCQKYQWGYRVKLDVGMLKFELYKGADRTASVVFSENYENLSATKYTEDETKMGNVCLIAGEGEGALRSRATAGTYTGANRYEIFVDAKDISKTITWGDLKAAYPTTSSGGQGSIITSGGNYYYQMAVLNIQIIDAEQLATLQTLYPDGHEVTISGISYYQVENVIIADLKSSAPEDGDEVVLRDVIYSVYLLTRGYEKMAEFGAVTSFEGSVEPNTTFIYGQDYFLGDLVTIENDFGITVQARITEIVEVDDDNGSSVEPKFEYVSIGG